MPDQYATVQDVKFFLQIEQTNTYHDAEIQAILDYVNGEIERMLARRVTLPLAPDDPLRTPLRFIAAKWAAGIFKERRLPTESIQVEGGVVTRPFNLGHFWVVEARKELETLLSNVAPRFNRV